MPRTLYDLLEVSQWAATAEIKRQFRRLAKRYHPDLNPGRGAPERFLEIQAAYHVLSNPLLRREYDEKLAPKQEFHWEPPPEAYDGPSHKVKVPRGFVNATGPFPSRSRDTEREESREKERLKRFTRRVWRAYIVVVLVMVVGLFSFAVSLAVSGAGFQAAVMASGGGMMLGLLFIAWIAKGLGNPDL